MSTKSTAKNLARAAGNAPQGLPPARVGNSATGAAEPALERTANGRAKQPDGGTGRLLGGRIAPLANQQGGANPYGTTEIPDGEEVFSVRLPQASRARAIAGRDYFQVGSRGISRIVLAGPLIWIEIASETAEARHRDVVAVPSFGVVIEFPHESGPKPQSQKGA